MEFPRDSTTVIEPKHVEGLSDERTSFLEALNAPIGTQPLAQIVLVGLPFYTQVEG